MSTRTLPKAQAKAAKAAPTKAPAKGRTARTKGVSMLPDELEDAATVEELTGVGFTEVYRRHFAPQMKAAAELLLEVREAGVELNRAVLRDTWDIHMGAGEVAAIYTAPSEMTRGQ